MYNWQKKDWKHFSYNFEPIEELIYAFGQKTGFLHGALQSLPEQDQIESLQDILVSEAIKTSEIEGEYLSRRDVLSSVRNNLGLSPNLPVRDIHAQGIANLVTDARQTFREPLTREILFRWHKMLFPAPTKITAGQWRSHSEPMQVVSGSVGKEKIHFEAPPSDQVPSEMEQFIEWFNKTSIDGKDSIKYAPIRSAIAHLYFETIHPFEDGNGRVGRVIAEKALMQTLGMPLLFSLSTTIESERRKYYEALQTAQKSNEITDWIIYFTDVILKSFEESEKLIAYTLQKTKLFDRCKDLLNERQIKVLNRMLREGPKGFEGGMTAKKYMRIASTSKATATRDLQKLHQLGVFKAYGSGRSTSYTIQFPD